MSLMEDLRVRIGIEFDDPSKDPEITLAKDTAFALMGNYCDRDFILAVGNVEKFTHLIGMTFPLRRYPVDTITSIVDDNGTAYTRYHINQNNGVVHMDDHGAYHELICTYTGGYDEDALPLDLLQAFYELFDQEYALVDGGAVSSAGELSAVTVFDVGTVKYNTDSADTSGAGAFLSPRAKALLDDYMRYKC